MLAYNFSLKFAFVATSFNLNVKTSKGIFKSWFKIKLGRFYSKKNWKNECHEEALTCERFMMGDFRETKSNLAHPFRNHSRIKRMINDFGEDFLIFFVVERKSSLIPKIVQKRLFIVLFTQTYVYTYIMCRWNIFWEYKEYVICIQKKINTRAWKLF